MTVELKLNDLRKQIIQLYNSNDTNEMSYIATDISDSIYSITHLFHKLKELKRYDSPNTLS